MTVAAQLAGRNPDSPAVESGTERWTAADLLAAVRRAADGLETIRGPVAIVLADARSQLVWALAADLAGATAAVLDARWPDRQRSSALAAIQPSTVVQDDGPVPHAGGGVEGRGWIAFTSGSTGLPGCVWRTPESWADSFAPFTTLLGLRAYDRVLVPGSLSSSLSAFAALHTLAAGGCAVLLPRWDAGRAPRVDVAHLVPSMLRDLVDQPEAAPPRVAVVGGATLDPDLEDRVCRRWPRLRLVQYYGSSEQSFVTARASGDPGTVGTAFPGVEITIRDDQGRVLSPGTPGQIWTTSPYAAECELTPEQSEGTGLPRGPRPPAGGNALQPAVGHPGPAERAHRVGRAAEQAADVIARPGGPLSVKDRGVLDADGVLTLLGRERIVTGGSTVEPATVEAVLRELAGVREAVVVGLPHPRLGELVTAVLDADAVALRTARAHVRERLSPAQRPRRWYTATPMPRTLSGKPARGEVSVAVRAGQLPRLQ
ncbi:MAG: AMP-binding protein [Geodermatophilaceae bacterium]|nr:AMP-binding protein [Geodermatophilaceae bacterium]